MSFSDANITLILILTLAKSLFSEQLCNQGQILYLFFLIYL